MNTFQVLALQKRTHDEPADNINAVRKMLDTYCGAKPDFMLLPEIFICPYDNSCFPVYAQKDGAESGEVAPKSREAAQEYANYIMEASGAKNMKELLAISGDEFPKPGSRL